MTQTKRIFRDREPFIRSVHNFCWPCIFLASLATTWPKSLKYVYKSIKKNEQRQNWIKPLQDIKYVTTISHTTCGWWKRNTAPINTIHRPNYTSIKLNNYYVHTREVWQPYSSSCEKCEATSELYTYMINMLIANQRLLDWRLTNTVIALWRLDEH